MSENIDIDYLRSWIDNQEYKYDVISSELLARFKATFSSCNESIFKSNSQLGLHWCIAQPSASNDELGEDGHPLKGSFLPPVPLMQRMWVSSNLEFHKKLKLDIAIKKISTIKDITLKESALSGPLLFLEINHIFEQEGNLCIEDNQTLVYRHSSQYKKSDPEKIEDKEIAIKVIPNSLLLFRYSAITFNGHRIHYDKDYAINKEGYPELVVHGPLMATLLMNLAQSSQENRILTGFKFRGVAPAFVNQTLNLSIRDLDSIFLEIKNDKGALIMKAEAKYN